MKKILAGLFISAMLSTPALARDQISIVGSSTVFPFSTTVAEKFGQVSGFKSPVVESTGSGGGLKMFCAGVGTMTPDIANASRAIKQKELDRCTANGVTPIERLIGYDGIVFANSKNGVPFNLTKEHIFKAVAYQVLINGEWVPNPYKNWSDIDSSLPDLKISIMIPPPTSGTRDAFVELIMHAACKKDYGMSKKEYKKNCSNVRTDGNYVVQVGENDNLIIEKLQNDENRFGVFGFSFLDQNRDKIQGAVINGVYPEFDTIADGSYTVSRPLFYYIKKEHLGIIPGIEEYDAMFKKLAAPGGILEEQGLITIN